MTAETIHSKFKDIAETGIKTAEELERGQATTPLADHFRKLIISLETAPFSIILLGLTQSARTHVISWLTGQPFSHLSVTVSRQSGLFQIELRERGSNRQLGYPMAVWMGLAVPDGVHR